MNRRLSTRIIPEQAFDVWRSGSQQTARAPSAADDAAREERVRMTRLKQTMARRLKEAQNTAAMLTTYNEVDMTETMALRSQYKDEFEKRHGVRLGARRFRSNAGVDAVAMRRRPGGRPPIR